MQIYESWGSFVCCLDLEKKKKRETNISFAGSVCATEETRSWSHPVGGSDILAGECVHACEAPG